MSPFVIYCLPRSRSYWLSRFLTYRDWTCAHDHCRYVRGMDDVRAWLSQDYAGAVDTTAAPFWRIQRDIRPDARVVVIRRDPEAVVESVARAGLPLDLNVVRRNIQRIDRRLDDIERHIPQAMRLTFEDLEDEAACAELFEFCLGEKHDHGWWSALAPLNLQINLRALVRYEIAHNALMARAKEEMIREVRRLTLTRNPVLPLDGFTFQEEPFDKFFEDGAHLFREHCVLVGEPPDEYLRKNVPLMRKLHEVGALQVVTARSNGKMFGYLATVMSPDPEHNDPNRRVAQQTSWYASPDARGIGLKLQRESIQRLEARGGQWRVAMRAGIRGEGPRMEVMFRRMGAKPDGQLWSLTVGKVN